MHQVARPAKVHRERAQWIVGTGGHPRWRVFTLGLMFLAYGSGWGPDRILALATIFVAPSGVAQPTMPMPIGTVTTTRCSPLVGLREIKHPQRRQVDDQAFARRIRQQELRGQHDAGALLRQPWVDARIGVDDFVVAEIEAARDVGSVSSWVAIVACNDPTTAVVCGSNGNVWVASGSAYCGFGGSGGGGGSSGCGAKTLHPASAAKTATSATRRVVRMPGIFTNPITFHLASVSNARRPFRARRGGSAVRLRRVHRAMAGSAGPATGQPRALLPPRPAHIARSGTSLPSCCRLQPTPRRSHVR